MNLKVKTFICGPLKNNVYVVFDDQTRVALIIDPSLDLEPVTHFIQQQSLAPESILITHAHFDHFYGVPYLQQTFPAIKNVYLHSGDLTLWRNGGGMPEFLGKPLVVQDPNCLIAHGQTIQFGGHTIEIRHAPGHSLGSVIYYFQELATVFCGDVIFFHSIGRTDLADGNHSELINSIQGQILSLPPETHLLSGHGPATTVAEEKANNPFL